MKSNQNPNPIPNVHQKPEVKDEIAPAATNQKSKSERTVRFEVTENILNQESRTVIKDNFEEKRVDELLSKI